MVPGELVVRVGNKPFTHSKPVAKWPNPKSFPMKKSCLHLPPFLLLLGVHSPTLLGEAVPSEGLPVTTHGGATPQGFIRAASGRRGQYTAQNLRKARAEVFSFSLSKVQGEKQSKAHGSLKWPLASVPVRTRSTACRPGPSMRRGLEGELQGGP